LPTIFIAGDSTAARGKGEQQQGWGVPFADYFDAAKVNVANRARGGTSSRTFITSENWDRLLADVKAGDLVLIQFGTTTAAPINDEPPPPPRARGTLPGIGDETKEIDNVVTKKHEVVHTYGWYLRQMIAEAKAKGATPIVLSTTVRALWNNGVLERGPADTAQWAYEVAKAANVAFIDVTSMVADQLEPMGEAKMKEIYPQDHTHFNAAGAELHAAAVVAGLKGLRPSPVANFLSARGAAVEADKFVWLRLPLPANPALPSLVLVGDSTVRNGRGDGAGGQWGWGDCIGPFFDLEKINLVNRAVGGTGVRNFISLGHWANALKLLKPGDVLMLQFGTNDNGPRGPLKGIGEETEERTDAATKQPETVHTYGWYLRKYIAETRARGATPIVCSLVPRKIWKDGKIQRNKDSHAGWAEQVAKAEGVAFVDLNELIARQYDALGQQKVDALFADEHTHTTAAGAELSASCVVAGLKALRDDPLDRFLSVKDRQIEAVK
jgi:lysophospholipase L1-like esterase